MWKSCARCGKIHDTKYRCIPKRTKPQLDEYRLRSTYQWTQKSLEIRERAQYLCEVCRDRDQRYSYNDLEVHHIDKVKDAPDLLLDNYNLVCLCVEHHKQADNGQISKEYLRSLAYQRELRYSDDTGQGQRLENNPGGA